MQEACSTRQQALACSVVRSLADPVRFLSILPWSDTLGITDPSQVAWGKDVTRWDDPNRYIDNVVNFAAEVGLDPTLPFTGFLKGGLSGAGKALKLAGGLEDVDDALRLVAKGGHAWQYVQA
jgi:hypothetical protein